MTLVAVVAGIIVILDQAVKWIALHALPPGVPVTVIDGFFSLTLVMNPGLAFGMLGTVPPGWRWMVALLSVVAVGVLATIATRLLPEGGRVAAVAYESQDIPGLALEVLPAQALGWKKCERCWTFSPRVGEDPEHPALCERCTPIIRALRS